MLLAGLIVIASSLTGVMFAAKQSMLGFAAVIFWALVGGQAYTLSTTPWGDIYFYLAFASLLGMTTLCAFGAIGLREKRDSIGDTEMEKGDAGGYIDEEKEPDLDGELDAPAPGMTRRTRGLRERAKRRRSQFSRKAENL